MQKFILLLAILFLGVSCEELVYTPKPRGYPKIEYPTKAYQSFQSESCDIMAFEYPKYAVIQQDSLFLEKQVEHPCWFDIYFPMYDSRLHCSYRAIDNNNSLEKLREDAFKMANEHNVRADYIDELPVNKPNGVSGFVFDIEGAAASPFQFYLTDGEEHFFRGALYFNTKARPDSLAPLHDFLKEDVMELINSFEWRERASN